MGRYIICLIFDLIDCWHTLYVFFGPKWVVNFAILRNTKKHFYFHTKLYLKFKRRELRSAHLYLKHQIN